MYIVTHLVFFVALYLIQNIEKLDVYGIEGDDNFYGINY